MLGNPVSEERFAVVVGEDAPQIGCGPVDFWGECFGAAPGKVDKPRLQMGHFCRVPRERFVDRQTRREIGHHSQQRVETVRLHEKLDGQRRLKICEGNAAGSLGV